MHLCVVRKWTMNISQILKVNLRSTIARIFPGSFPRLYSTLDHPIEVPSQVVAYELTTHKYLRQKDKVLDVGFGLGYGLKIMAEKDRELSGIDIDRRAVSHAQQLIKEVDQICRVEHYNGRKIPFDDNSFDVVTCIDVIEHVPDYSGLLMEMVRVSKRLVLLATPNRRPEYTRPDGKPKNYWHLREWTLEELKRILNQHDFKCEWNFINGPFEGPFTITKIPMKDTLSLVPVILLAPKS